MHWVLDVVFGDDDSRLRSAYGPRNMALVQRIALNLIRLRPSGKDSFTGRFTAEDALEATVRVRRGEGAERCDTGPITFVAHRVGP